MQPQIDHVSDTALWVATYRAEETLRPDALFHDPLAGRLAGEKGRQISRTVNKSKYVRWSVIIRTCIIDRFVTEQVAQGVDLVLNLGAGLDTRPYRLKLPPELRWVEADFPALIEEKNRALAQEKPLVRLERRAVDLSNDSARAQLLDELQASAKKILVITEGVVPYLSNEQVAALGRDLAARDHFRFWVADYNSPRVLEYMRKGKRLSQFRNAPFLFNPPEWFSFFRSIGWESREVKYLVDESRRLGRAIPMPLIARMFKIFISRNKFEEMSRYSAYVLLEPAN
ncbi:MAG: class I SAM-dependent methyltransferase [Bdellovibrionota bacterium]